MRIEEMLEERFDHNAYYKTFNGRIKKMYDKAVTRTRSKGHKGDMISLDDFKRFAEKNRTYKRLFQQWVDSGYDLRHTPTLDRVDHTKGYHEDNLQFLPYAENVVKGNKEYNKNPSIHRMKKIKFKKGSKTKEFDSMSDAARFFNTSPATVSRHASSNTPIDGWEIQS